MINLSLTLEIDASDAIVLVVYCFKKMTNGQRKNIYFHSQMLPKPQRKWPTIEKGGISHLLLCIAYEIIFIRT